MKKKIPILIALLLSVFLSGCALTNNLFPSNEESQVSKTAESFLKSLHEGRISDAMDYCTAISRDEADFDMNEMIADKLGWYAFLPGVSECIPDITQMVFENTIRDWKIEGVKVKGDTATATIAIKGIDVDSGLQEIINDLAEEFPVQWGSDAADEILGYMMSHNLEDSLTWLGSEKIEEFIMDFLNLVQETFDNWPLKESFMQLQFVKNDDGQWLIDQISQELG